MNEFDHAWNMTTEHHRVSPTVRVTIQTRAVNVYTYVEDLVRGEAGALATWRIRTGTVRTHGSVSNVHTDTQPHPRLLAKARAEKLWHELRLAEIDRSRGQETGLDIAALRRIAQEELSSDPSS